MMAMLLIKVQDAVCWPWWQNVGKRCCVLQDDVHIATVWPLFYVLTMMKDDGNVPDVLTIMEDDAHIADVS